MASPRPRLAIAQAKSAYAQPRRQSAIFAPSATANSGAPSSNAAVGEVGLDYHYDHSPREAQRMDPQERLFLEVAWHALEDAGWTRRDLARARRAEFSANVGVFAGVTSNPYALLGHPGGGHAAPTSLPWSLANRVSYLFNFNGPSLPVDTACSSSLTAIHLAVQAIRRGECQQAIAGGVNLYLHPSKFSHLSLMQMLSRDGRCRAFGAGADGFVPGEGVGTVVLKRLSDAERDGDEIYGVIIGSGISTSCCCTGC